jgi:hypothetical protein
MKKTGSKKSRDTVPLREIQLYRFLNTFVLLKLFLSFTLTVSVHTTSYFKQLRDPCSQLTIANI